MDQHALETVQKDIGLIDLCLGTDETGADVFIYTEIKLEKYDAYKKAALSGVAFDPTDFGKVIAHGKGYPSAAIIAELREKYGFWDGFEDTMTKLSEELRADAI